MSGMVIEQSYAPDLSTLHVEGADMGCSAITAWSLELLRNAQNIWESGASEDDEEHLETAHLENVLSRTYFSKRYRFSIY